MSHPGPAPEPPRVLSVGTAVPPHEVAQADARELTRALFGNAYPDIDRLVAVFDNGLIGKRHVVMPLEWYAHDRPWPERNALYVQCALDLGEAAARQALRRARLTPTDIEAIVVVSTTGIATPSLDALLLKRLGLSAHARRLPVWGLGCAGGTGGLNRAADLALARPGERVLLIAVELCSLTFQKNDLSRSNLVAASLFADGAAAAVVGPGEGPRLIGSSSTLWEDTEDVMGWDLNGGGLRVRFSRDVPALVERLMRADVEHALSANGRQYAELRHVIAHPGGLKVLRALEAALALEPDALTDAHAVLAEYGNMSSASVLFVLERFLRRWPELAPNELAIATAMGPGFSAEHTLMLT